MKTFENLASEKRERIINAAMHVFAIHGYHKASVVDIARTAGISKAMIFTYFGSKCGCYEYLCNEILKITLTEFEKVKDKLLDKTDYFERIALSARVKIDILKQYSALLLFAISVYSEQDEEVQCVKNRILSEAFKLREMLLTTDIDSSKFKNPSDAMLVGKMLLWLSEGCANEWSRSSSQLLDDLLAEFIDCIKMLKKCFYKEECL